MKSQILLIAETLDHESALTLSHALRAVNGVGSVVCATDSNQVNVAFDEDLTSLQEIETVLGRVGYRLRRAMRAHGEHSCCGSCGG